MGFESNYERMLSKGSISAALGATAAFLVGRYLARDVIARKIEKNEKFATIDRAVANEGAIRFPETAEI